MKLISLCSSILLSLTVGLGAAAAASAASPIGGEAVYSFRQNPTPENVESILSGFDGLSSQISEDAMRSAGPQFVGWAAGAFGMWPDRVADWAKPKRKPLVDSIVLWALLIAGHPDLANDVAARSGFNVTSVPADANNPEVLLKAPTSLYGADLIVGAAYATGDPIYVERLIDVFDVPMPVEESDLLFGRGFKSKEDFFLHLKKFDTDRANRVFLRYGSIYALIFMATKQDFALQALAREAANSERLEVTRALLESMLKVAESRRASGSG